MPIMPPSPPAAIIAKAPSHTSYRPSLSTAPNDCAVTRTVKIAPNAAKHTHGETIVAALSPKTLTSSRPVNLIVTVTDPHSGKPLSNSVVTADMAMMAMDIGTVHPQFALIGGKWVSTGAFSMGGDWEATVHVKSPGEKPVDVLLKFTVGQ